MAVAFLAACVDVKPTREDYAGHLKHLLRDSLGGASLPDVSFIGDSTHLLVRLSGVEFRRMDDTTFARKAAEIARLAVRRYEQGTMVESVTVSVTDRVVNGNTPRSRERTFPTKAR
jgi:hypothetical protein